MRKPDYTETERVQMPLTMKKEASDMEIDSTGFQEWAVATPKTSLGAVSSLQLSNGCYDFTSWLIFQTWSLHSKMYGSRQHGENIFIVVYSEVYTLVLWHSFGIELRQLKQNHEWSCLHFKCCLLYKAFHFSGCKKHWKTNYRTVKSNDNFD